MRRIWLLAVALSFTAELAFGFGTTFVSVHGTDSAFCGANFAPCFSLQAAYTNTDTGGLIKAMDANAFAPGGLIIRRAVTIDGSGLAVLENIFAPTAPVIQIFADCTIRGVVLQVTAGDGIQIASAVHVHLQDITIQGLAGAFTNGIHVVSSGADVSAEGVTVTGAAIGLNVAASNTTFNGSRLKILQSTTSGISMLGGSGALRDSIVRGPGTASASTGISLAGATLSLGSLMVERCEISFNATGVHVDGSGGSATLRVADSVISGNATGLVASAAGQIISFRTNMIAGNGSDGTPPLGTSLK